MSTVRLFGTTLSETVQALSRRPVTRSTARETSQVGSDDRTKAIMRIIVTLVLLALAAYLLIAHPESEDKTIPASIISAVLGYWLK